VNALLQTFLAPWPVALACMLGGLWVMDRSSDRTVDALLALSRHYRISQVFAGAFLAATASSLPELFASIASVGLDHIEVGMGTIMGSAVFNVVVIVGLSALVARGGAITVRRSVLWRDLGAYIITLIVTLVFFYNDLWIGGSEPKVVDWEIWTWVLLYGIYFGVLLRSLRADPVERQGLAEIASPTLSRRSAWFWFAAGMTGIGLSSHLLVSATLALGEHIPFLNATILSLLVVALGTSLPDLLVSMSAARKGAGSMAVANAVGSNTFNILVGLGLPWGIRALLVRSGAVAGDPWVPLDPIVAPNLPFVLGSCILVFALLRTGYRITRREGWAMLAFYGVYVIFVLNLARSL
jgi:cation:H+ antiporter